ncbi:N-acetylmuramoyl-L-alanine amidase [Microvirga aerilata]|uniref:N-acetylmuramoyl-L-alanine amidase n=2 Tax=Microvirga aerilata TaxID=670292 RepID=A0A936ZHN9_9HYPH|nr:N-acetylmuramoyl-L-alanine amidase [Microvirga aerilata]
MGTAAKRIGDVVGRVVKGFGGCNIIDLTASSDRSVEKGTRDTKKVFALVLHQMACCHQRRDPLRSYLGIKAHYAILPDGRILQLHGVDKLIWASHGFNNGSVAVEFAGNFPNIHGKWWKGDTYGRNKVTAAQIEAGRCLVRHLVRTIGLRTVLAHRQSSDTRENDPGPDIWYNVGQWAVTTLGLSDGGPGFKVGSGKPILDAWRTWGTSGLVREAEAEVGFQTEFNFEEGEETEDELWRGEPEGNFEGEVPFAEALRDPRAKGPGIYTLFKGGKRLYAGRADNLQRRLATHLWYMKKHDANVGDYAVKLTPLAGADPSKLSRVESATIRHWGTRTQGGPLTNVKTRELEVLPLSTEAWT